MVSNPELVRFACDAHHGSSDITILAEFNSADSSLKELAHQCLNCVPPNHTIFSHTHRNQTYSFLIIDPFVYFGIFDAKMIKQDQFELLGRLKDALDKVIKGKKSTKFTSHCFQGELHPIFHKLMSKSCDLDAQNLVPNDAYTINTPTPTSGSTKSGRKILSVPFWSFSKFGKGIKKKRFCGDATSDSKEGLVDGKVDLLSDDAVSEMKSRDIVCQNGVCYIDRGGSGGGGGGGHGERQKAKKIWRKHVWIVLVLDLAVCLILFGIWLFVCRGFQCIEG